MNEKFPSVDALPNMVQSFVDSSHPTARVYDVIMDLNSPAPVEDISDLALCSVEETEEALELLLAFDIVRRNAAVDATVEFEPNDGYFFWRHAHSLAGKHTAPEINEIESQLDEAVADLTETYGVDHPEGIPLDVEDSAVREKRQEAVSLWYALAELKDVLTLARTLQSVYASRGAW
jgi:hypothetical protein